MRSRTTREFWKLFQELPESIQERARARYRLWRTSPDHTSLSFKRVHETEPLYSVRISLNYRAIGLAEGDTMTWFWIGSHADYDEKLRRL